MEQLQRDLSLLDHSAFVGTLVQALGTLLLLFLFGMIARQSGAKPWFRDWTWAWLALLAGLLALVARYIFFFDAGEVSNLKPTPLPEERALHFVYQVCKLCYLVLIPAGCLAFAGWRGPFKLGQPGRLGQSGKAGPVLAALLLAFAMASTLFSTDLDGALVWQAPLDVLAFAAGGLCLLRLPRERRSLGSNATGVVLCVHAGLWILYAIAFQRALGGEKPSLDAPFSLIAFYNPYIDVLAQLLLGFCMVLLLLQELQREAAQARERQQQLSRKLSEAQKLEAVGRLVSGVAHELNNPLTAILGFSEQLLEDGPRPESGISLTVIKEQALRCRSIVRDLLSFVGSREERWEEVELQGLIERVVKGLAPELARLGARFSLAPAPPLQVRADRAGLEQVLSNLLTNAAQAAGRGGEVHVRARADGDSLEIVVEDNGPGVPEAIRSRIFEPFFTTKPAGQGSGLGLAVSHGIVRGHGGTIEVTNLEPPARGARFVVRLPLRPRSAPSGYTPWPRSLARPSTPLPRAPTPLPRSVTQRPPSQPPAQRKDAVPPQRSFAGPSSRPGSSAGTLAPRPSSSAGTLAARPGSSAGTLARPRPRAPATPLGSPGERPLSILIVDDDLAVRNLLRQVYERAGWSVEESEDGAAALQRLLAPGTEAGFDLVLSDLKMPRTTGLELYERLAGERPGCERRLVFITGNTLSPEALEFAERTGCPVVSKPFDMPMLVDLCERRARNTRADPAG